MKREFHKIFNLGFFHESYYPYPLIIPLIAISILFSNIRKDFRNSRWPQRFNETGNEFISGINNTFPEIDIDRDY